MNEFFSALYIQDMVAGFDNRVSDGDFLGVGPSGSDFPLASPDSITVTTEFGVVEESGTVTIISASGPSPHHQLFDNDTEEENNVEMTEDLNDDLPELQGSLAQLQLPTVTEVSVEHMQDVSDDEAGEEADIDTDGFDADAFIDEFMDDGEALTPTASTTA
jgi:hypothetical protein